MNRRYVLFGLLVIVAGAALFRILSAAPLPVTVSVPRQIATASYQCADSKTIEAVFYEGTPGPQPASYEPPTDQPPTPTGSVSLTLSDGRKLTLPQTISADGGRYADKSEAFVFWTKGDGAFIQENQKETYAECAAVHVGATYKDATYFIDEGNVTLVHGRAEMQLDPTSASVTVTQYFGNDAIGDLNGDGQPDIAFILTQSTGGTGTFYYVVAALKVADGYQGTNAVFLGDRIAPQTLQIRDGKLVANYADRKPKEPMTAKPTIGVSKYLTVRGTELTEVPRAVLGEHCDETGETAPMCATGLVCAYYPEQPAVPDPKDGTCVTK